MSDKEILLGYAKKGEPESIWDVMCGYKWGDEEKAFEVDEEAAKRWGMALKKLAMEGNIIAQKIIADYTPHRAWEDFSTGESEEQIADMQKSFRNHIFALADEGNVEAVVTKSYMLYDTQDYEEGWEEQWLSILTTAAEAGSSRACEELYRYYDDGGFTLYKAKAAGFVGPEADAYSAPRINTEKAMYYLQKGANCTDYYSYRCKKRMADEYYRAILSGGSGLSLEQAKKYLESYKYWLRLAAESGSLEALEKEKTIGQDIAFLGQMNPALGGLNSHYVSSKAATPTQGKKGGCYVATCVYGSYDCPEVWVLRRYRDNVLADTWYGRAFIRFYYWAGPKAVKWFGKTAWFHRMFKGPIDSMVEKLKSRGFADTPYRD